MGILISRKKRKSKSKRELNVEESEGLEEEVIFLSEQPSLLRGGTLREHQLVGLNWLISLYEIGFNGILADEMGLGKTIQAIAFFAYLLEHHQLRRPFLIVCPNSVVSNWKREFNKWLPQLQVIKLIARKEYRFEIIKNHLQTNDFDVIVTSYEGVNICLRELRKIKWEYIMVDEAHRIKNDQSLLSKNLRYFKGCQKLLITGTPLQNNLRELWSLLNFIMPELFNDSSMFEDQQQNMENLSEAEIEKKNIELIKNLHKILKPFLLKRTKAVIDKSIPPKKEIHVLVGLTKIQTEIYKNLLLKKKPTPQSSRTSLLNILMHLRKVCNHPYLFEGVEQPGLPVHGDHLVTTSGKMIILDKILEKLKFNHQVLIFSQFTSMLNIIEDYLIYKKFEYCRIDGSTFLEEREEQIQEFTKKDSRKYVFLLSTRAGGLGINLTTADTVILYDSDWNPQVDLQAMDRAHRIGQTKNVNVYRLITENTVEEKIVERQRIKLKWDNLVILKGKIQQKNKVMNKNEMKDLVQFGASEIFKANEGTIKTEDLDLLLQRGEKRAIEVYKKVDDFVKKNSEKLFDLGVNSINVYEFEGDDYKRKRKQDKQILENMYTVYQQSQKPYKRYGKYKYKDAEELPKKEKIVKLPVYQLYQEKEKLEKIMSKEANGNQLTQSEVQTKDELLKTGFQTITKQEYHAIVKGFEKINEDDYQGFADLISRKEVELIKQFILRILQNLEILPEKNKIARNIEKNRKNRRLREEQTRLLQIKCSEVNNFFEIKFENQLYNKVKSKFYSMIQDKFILHRAYIHGPDNFVAIKKDMQKERIFTYDFYLKNIKLSLLGKRIVSLIRMLKNEVEHDRINASSTTDLIKQFQLI